MQVKIGVSNRHVHLTKEDFNYLFGDISLTKNQDLTQVGEYKSNMTVKLIGPKNEIDNVRIVGPFRDYTQVEVSKTDCFTLGINAPVRSSEDLKDAAVITICNNDKKITRPCCIVANRHIHINKKEQELYNLYKPCYKVKINSEKGAILDNVFVKVEDNYKLELHLDTDDANANLVKTGDYAEIIDD